MRLHKFIANCGYTSRRRAELLIQAGRVQVNGKVLTSLGTVVFLDKDVVYVNGEEIRLPEPLTVVFNKPGGVITSTHDTHERLTVMDLLPRSLRDRGVLPVGRLDQDTEGLLLLTNDGDLNHQITHPSFEIDKEYRAVVRGRPSQSALKKLERGIVIEGGKTAPAKVQPVDLGDRESTVDLVIHEGRKRQVRKMFAAIGHEVTFLFRKRIGDLSIGNLKSGDWRELTAEEIDGLRAG